MIEERREAHLLPHVSRAVGLLISSQAADVTRPPQSLDRIGQCRIDFLFGFKPCVQKILAGTVPAPFGEVGRKNIAKVEFADQAFLKVAGEEGVCHRAGDLVLFFQQSGEAVGRDKDTVGVENDGFDEHGL